MDNNLKSWHGWLLFGVSMTVVFGLGLAVSALSERCLLYTSPSPRD